MRTAHRADRPMPVHFARLTLVALALLAIPGGPAQAEAPEPQLDRLKAHVETLASQEYGGRRGKGGRKTAEYLIRDWEKLSLAPLFDGSYSQEIPDPKTGRPIGRNVGAKLTGSDPALRDRWIIVSAHYDHLGTRDGVLYPGADDNASGVAMLLEVARCFAVDGERPRRSVMFIGFDLEEIGLYGSRYFAEHSPVPLDRIDLFITADMIARSLGGGTSPLVFAIGTEHAPGLRPWIDRAAAGRPIRVGLMGADVTVIDRSDYGPFRSRQVPFLFFSTGENPRYHTPDDTPETLDYPKLEAISRTIGAVARTAASADSVPTWEARQDNPVAEALAIREAIRALQANEATLKIGSAQRYLMRNAVRTIDAIEARGVMTPEERIGLVRVARIILFTVL